MATVPEAASGSNGISLPSQSWGVGFCLILLVWGKREEKHINEGTPGKKGSKSSSKKQTKKPKKTKDKQIPLSSIPK